MIPEKTLRELQERLDIVEVIGGYLPLKKSGRNFKALCPFHPEKTASFMIYPQKQFYICYGCGAGGDLISFVMRHEHLEFSEAVQHLAQKAGIEMPRGTGGRSQATDPELYRVHELAQRFYQDSLLKSAQGEGARSYLKKRGVDPALWETFGLGYAPDQWDGLISLAKREGWTPQLLEKAGLAIPREGNQGWYDRFRNRVIFPIWDSRGRVIAFGGRILKEEGPKYMNSPETELYVKGRVLYGLHLAAPHIRQQDFCIVVEGYMDLISPYQYGIQNIVSSMGTSLTESQVQLIRRMTRHVVMVYDGDYAGEMATVRGLDLFLEAEMRVKVAVLPPGMDPDSLVKSRGIEAFARALHESQDLFDFKLGLLKRRFDPKEVEGRVGLCAEMLPTIKRVPNAIQRGDYIKRLSELLGVEESLLWTELGRVKGDTPSWKPTVVADLNPKTALTAEGLLAGLLLEEPSRVTQLIGRLEIKDLKDTEVQRVVSFLMKLQEEGSTLSDHQTVRRRLSSGTQEWENRSARWLAWADTIEKKEQVLEEILEKIRKSRRQDSLELLRASIRQAEESGDEAMTTQLIMEFNHLMKTHAAKHEVA